MQLGEKCISRAEWRTLPYVDADHKGWRRLAAAVLLLGYQERAECFLRSDRAKTWAELLDLPTWPPAERRSKGELRRLLRASQDEAPESLGSWHVRSRNPEDHGGPLDWRQGPAVVDYAEWK